MRLWTFQDKRCSGIVVPGDMLYSTDDLNIHIKKCDKVYNILELVANRRCNLIYCFSRIFACEG